MDRITDARLRPGPKFTIRAIPDIAARVSIGAATAMWHYRARVIAHAPAETLVGRLPPAVQVESIDERTCRLHVGSSSAPMLAAYLGLLGTDFTLEDPRSHPELVEAIRSLSTRFLRAVDYSFTPGFDPHQIAAPGELYPEVVDDGFALGRDGPS